MCWHGAGERGKGILMTSLLQDMPPRPLGWSEVKALYLRGVPLKEVSRLSQFSPNGILAHANREGWPSERAQLPALVKAQVLSRWGEDAHRQAQELMVTISRNVELVEGELTKLEQGHIPQGKRISSMGQLQAILTQATQSLRLLMGSATERKEVQSLAQLVVELRAKGYGEGASDGGLSRGKRPLDPSLLPPLPSTPLANLLAPKAPPRRSRASQK